MATKAKGITVRATPGRNARVDPVVRLEDLLQKMQQAPAKAARGRAAAAGGPPAPAAARQLAAELEAQLREWRAATAPAKGGAKRSTKAGTKG